MLYLFFSISIVFTVSEGVLQCRGTDCVLCDCWNQTQLPQTLTCDSYHFIRLEFFELRRMRHTYFLGNRCDNMINTSTLSCYGTMSQTMPVHFNQKLEIYNQCNGKRTCDVIFPTDSPVKLEIPYVCESEADLRLISTRFAQNAVTFPIFSLWGKDYTKGEILNCECQMEIPKNMSALIEVFFIYLDPEACNKVIFSNKNIPIFSCNKYGLRLLYGPQGNIEGDMKIQIKDLVIEGDEVIYFKLRGENMNINCNGCSDNSDSPESPESPEVSESFMYHVILGTVFGILAVVFLVVAVCVLYRLRKRKLSRQRGQRSPQQIIENEHYDYIDDDAPTNMKNNCHSHQYLDLINSPDGYLTPQVPAAHQRPLGPRTSAESSYNRIVV